ncbi:cold-shock protein [Pseudonocardia kunmingensis]|uniref:Cold shock CspA family protein n=1 Tax=Pseudonocardia kunmingensis TaxID=630975 RepID=A0A543E238_9PSEU|nr:cold shock domain-containing protein [Pseudonocardia kunmingensis]TQM15645.1 cold shock CspA family protein [Pseudonocardia kunmingensis]
MSDHDNIVTGRVHHWYPEDGWGVLESDALDGLVFAHFSVIRDQTGWRGLEAGQRVTFSWRQPGQDGCEYSAVDVYTTESRGSVDQHTDRHPDAYRSSLTITFDEP